MKKIINRKYNKINNRTSTNKKAFPPPIIISIAQIPKYNNNRFRKGYNAYNKDITEKKPEEEKPKESPTKFTRRRFFTKSNNIPENIEKIEEPEIKPQEPKEETREFKRSYMGKFKKGKSTLDQEIPKKLIEEENKPRFKKHNYDIKEDNKDKIKEKEEEPVTQSKPSYFNRYSRKKFESRKEKEINVSSSLPPNMNAPASAQPHALTHSA